ncbi:MAG: hypothetical protein IH946_06760, partial [Bacteroidetes bacterium]|nr:hypothetical protein [Bacteroidota bacterium]
MWYLQFLENTRTDISLIDVSLLNADWYPSYIQSKGKVNFGYTTGELDTLQHIFWPEHTVSVDVTGRSEPFTWTIMPSYDEAYILKSDRILLGMLKENQFKRDVYFTIGFAPNVQLSLGPYIIQYPLIDKLTTAESIL